MGDRTYHCVTIVDCPKDQAAAALVVLNDHFGFSETSLEIGECYEVEELTVGTSDLIAKDLITFAPGCSFRASEDPKYEWLGTVHWYVPGLGHFAKDGDAQGRPVWNAEEILALTQGQRNLPDDDLHRALGVSHDAALQGLHDRNQGTTITPAEEND